MASKSDFAKFVHEYVRTYIASADQKSTIIFSIAAAIFAYIESNGALRVIADPSKIKTLPGFLGAGAALLLVVCGAMALAVIWPRLKPRTPKGLIYWCSIIDRTEDSLVSEVDKLTDAERDEQILRQFYVLSKVCDHKYNLLANSIRIGVAAFAFVVLFTVFDAIASS